MLLNYFYDPTLAHASYLVGCQATGEAVVVDPGRDVEPYLAAAAMAGLRVSAVTETHIHADYVSGARELAERARSTLYLSDEGEQPWKYEFAHRYPAKLLHEGDHFMVGHIRFDVLHTPGHTPESLSFLVTDQGGGASAPIGIFTGDFVFVGAVGRPDLLEKAVGVTDNAVVGARQMFASLQRFKALPEYLQVWPAHGAGSACGKGLGAIPSSTVGYEKRFNPALQYEDEAAFVRYLLADQPEVPPYFKEMKRINKEGPALLAGQGRVPHLPPSLLPIQLTLQNQVVDVRPTAPFAAGHVPGTLNIPLDKLGQWAGWLLSYEQPLYLIASEEALPEAHRLLAELGLDQLAGYFVAAEVEAAELARQRYEEASPMVLAPLIANGEHHVLDVRTDAEWAAGHLPGAHHCFLGALPQQLATLDRARPIVVQCRSGARSAIAASLLQATGFKEVINMQGGYQAWVAAGLPSERDDTVKQEKVSVM